MLLPNPLKYWLKKLVPAGSLALLLAVYGCQEENFEDVICTVRGDYVPQQWYFQSGGMMYDSVNNRKLEQQSEIPVNVAVVSDGLDSRHCDLKDQIDYQNSYNYYNKRRGSPILSPDYMKRGTVIAGLIAAKDDSIGITGIAPKSKIAFFNLIDNIRTPKIEAEVMTRNSYNYDISVNSWAAVPGSDSFVPATLGEIEQWQNAIDGSLGFGGAGTNNSEGVVYIFSAGEKGLINDNLAPARDSNLNAYTNYHGVMAICTVDSENTQHPAQQVTGANLLVCAPSIGNEQIISSDVLGSDAGYNAVSDSSGHKISDDYTNNESELHSGDISAALAAGVAALIRSTRNNHPETTGEHTWRDVKHILIQSAEIINDPEDNTLVDNGNEWPGGVTTHYQHSEKYGFGVVSAVEAVKLAQNWQSLGDSDYFRTELHSADFPDSTHSSSIDIDSPKTEGIGTRGAKGLIEVIEYVEIEVITEKEGDLTGAIITLTSPKGVVSTLVPYEVAKHLSEKSIPFPTKWRFGSVRDLGADPEGSWTLKVEPYQASGKQPTLNSWGIRFYGRLSK